MPEVQSEQDMSAIARSTAYAQSPVGQASEVLCTMGNLHLTALSGDPDDCGLKHTVRPSGLVHNHTQMVLGN